MAESFMSNIQSIEMGQLVLDGSNPTNCLMIQTLRNKYCFRLSDTYPMEKQVEIFKQFVTDIKTPTRKPTLEEVIENEKIPTWEPGGGEDVEKPIPAEKHDGAKLFDEAITPPADVEIEVKE